MMATSRAPPLRGGNLDLDPLDKAFLPPVPSANGGNRLEYGSRSPSGVTCDPTLEDTRQKKDARATRRSHRI
ncbi:hypothetical protein PC116_g17718 [Phytophthora cactorum]|uniref:Uncharacterized protein n=1 Tax=Phytophthora cactorum TaxID=29920 RepID=A0A8T1KAH3_9STRA|nr:hypothetical protein Pcac1_g11073 [Phytophthora cactorum]KAG2902295.1 hypothetical protein PC117_g21508 [Phytophthora cactorum]KAG4234104.1 hypothetical protein PC116_g17718 [Phytophthora cactorum]